MHTVRTLVPIKLKLIPPGNRCGTGVRRQVGMMETAVLHSHHNTCKKRTYGQPLHEYGFTGGSRLSKGEVCELWAIWIAEHARPYIIVDDNHVSDMISHAQTHAHFEPIIPL